MNDLETYFVVPTHRLRDVSETIHDYDEHFWRNGHSPQMIVFDDSTPSNVEKYFTQLEQLKTRSDLFYVSPPKGRIPRLSQLAASEQASGTTREESVPSELRRQ